MVAVFFDTSALVKRYLITEFGVEAVRSLLDAQDLVPVIAQATRVEVASAFGRRFRESRFNLAERDAAWNTFLADVEKLFFLIEPNEEIWSGAERLCLNYPLTAYDAIQISTALRGVALLANDGTNLRFCTADRRQAEAASREGLAVELIA